MHVSILFPGQGSQHAGQARQLLADFPYARVVFEEASDATHDDLLRLCTHDDAGPQLTLTEFAQPAILTTSLAWWKIWQREMGLNAQSAAGHSLGEYSALTASQAIPLADVVALVRLRGQFMRKANLVLFLIHLLMPFLSASPLRFCF